MANWRCVVFSASYQRISASQLSFVTPDGIGHSSSGFWKNITSAGCGRNLAPFEFLPCTSDFLDLRLLGDYSTKYDVDGGHVHHYKKLLWKREAALESWSLKIERHRSEVRNVWAFVSNHFEGFAPETCQRLAQRLDLSAILPSETEQVASAQKRSQLDLQL
jgi:uncharacterized protein YecE (DUF72 family)